MIGSCWMMQKKMIDRPELVAISEKDEREHHEAKAQHGAVAAGRRRANHERLVLLDRVIGGEAVDHRQVGRGHVTHQQNGDCVAKRCGCGKDGR